MRRTTRPARPTASARRSGTGTAGARPGDLRAAAAAVLVGALLVACGGDAEPGDTPDPEPTAEPTETASPEPTEPTEEPTEEPTDEPAEPGAEATVPAYFMIDTRAGLRLAREMRTAEGTEPVRSAVEAMLAGPDDPDYGSAWAPGTELLGISRQEGGFTVDLSSEAREANIGSEGAALMIQQLVWTVTDAAEEPDATVMLHLDGEPAGELWGAVSWDSPQGRDDDISVRLLVQIDDPVEGARLTSPVTVSGEAAVFEATVLWRVLDESGTEVDSGFTNTSEGQTFAPYSFELELEPGGYTVVIEEDDPSDGEAGEPMSDSRRFVVE